MAARATMPFHTPALLIGVSARIYYPAGPVLDLGGVWTKTLHYLEQSVAQLLMRGGALPLMIPAVDAQSVVQRTDLHLGYYARELDGLVLQGGNDVAPQSYGEAPLDPAWTGDIVRDRYEMELVNAFVEAGKPVFGICRGLQLINVNFGGTLYQDIPTQLPDAARHINHEHYEHNLHRVRIEPGTRLAELYGGFGSGAMINSIHHQGIKDLSPSFTVEARCADDGMIEAIRHQGQAYIVAVQWHPEFHPLGRSEYFDDRPMMRDFLAACRRAKA
jgi:putative glutamine amidotransferase